MKKMMMTAMLLMLSITAFAKDIHKLVVSSERMHCAKCAERVTTGLEKVDGVKSIFTDLSTHQITVYYDEGKVDDSKLLATLIEIGYASKTVSNEKVKKAPKMKKAKGPAAECSMGKCEDEKKEGEKDKKADGVTGATRK